MSLSNKPLVAASLILAAAFFGGSSWRAMAESNTEKSETEPFAKAASINLRDLPKGSSMTEAIDADLASRWNREKVTPSEVCDDKTFVRRIYLDLIGRIPTPAELNAILLEDAPNRRELWIDAMLEHSEHAIHFAQVYDALLIGRTNRQEFNKRKDAGWFKYLEAAVQTNRPWDAIAAEILLARNDPAVTPGANWYLYARNNKPQDIAEAVSRDFFGVRIDCAQCHDHPLSSEIKQNHYWGLVAFFNRSKNVGDPKNARLTESAIGGFSDFSNTEGESYPNELVFLGDRKVEETRPGTDTKEEDRDELYAPGEDKEFRVPKFSRREQFVQKVLKDHPLLAKSMVNRMWGWMMGRGIVHPIDAIDSYHPASHPELLDWLAEEFATSGYDVKRLVKSLAMTRAYQLESRHQGPIDPKFFASVPPKPLTAEMLHRSMLTALEPRDRDRWNTVEYQLAFAKQFPDVLTEESIANVSQGLMLTNGDWINSIVSPESSAWVDRMIRSQQSYEATVNEAFDRLFSRKPDPEELALLCQFLDRRGEHRERAVSDFVWALITSSEFRFNH